MAAEAAVERALKNISSVCDHARHSVWGGITSEVLATYQKARQDFKPDKAA